MIASCRILNWTTLIFLSLKIDSITAFLLIMYSSLIWRLNLIDPPSSPHHCSKILSMIQYLNFNQKISIKNKFTCQSIMSEAITRKMSHIIMLKLKVIMWRKESYHLRVKKIRVVIFISIKINGRASLFIKLI